MSKLVIRTLQSKLCHLQFALQPYYNTDTWNNNSVYKCFQWFAQFLYFLIPYRFIPDFCGVTEFSLKSIFGRVIAPPQILWQPSLIHKFLPFSDTHDTPTLLPWDCFIGTINTEILCLYLKFGVTGNMANALCTHHVHHSLVISLLSSNKLDSSLII